MSWYTNSSESSDIVLSSRCRLARNIAKTPIGDRLNNEKAAEIIELSAKSLGDGFDRIDFDRLPPDNASAYVEEHLVSADFLGVSGPHTLFKNTDTDTYVMVCEEDHFRIQSIVSGNDPELAYKNASAAERVLASSFELAFDPSLGYLTHCPTNLGTAMRISLMMFLPAMTKYRMIGQLGRSLAKLGFTVRGMYGEGSDALGCLYQISNSTTLGVSEEETLKNIVTVSESIVNEEKKLREKLLDNDSRDNVIDMCSRAYGLLTHCHKISHREFLASWVEVRLGKSLRDAYGIDTGIPSEITYQKLDTLLIEAQPSVLTLLSGGQPLTPDERDIRRAAFIRSHL